MSRLDEMIQEICPDGVEYCPLKTVATITRGGNFQKKHLQDEGVPCIHYGEIYTQYGMFTDVTKSKLAPNIAEQQPVAYPGSLIVALTSENMEDVCKATVWEGETNIAVSGDAAILTPVKAKLNSHFIAYYLHSNSFRGAKPSIAQGTKVMHASVGKLGEVLVPVPPLSIQQEIVRILDTFTELEAELEADLEAELEARKKQYRWYESYLLDNIDGEMTQLKGICGLKAGVAISKPFLSATPTDTLRFACYGGNGIRGYTATYNQSGNYPIIGRQGALCGNVQFAQGEFYATEHAVVVHPSVTIDGKFLFYALRHANLSQYKTSGAQPGLSVSTLSKVAITVPPLHQQKYIVSILDRFDTLTNDLTSGLPAEIAARRKQYEYYRDKLLTFPRKQD